MVGAGGHLIRVGRMTEAVNQLPQTKPHLIPIPVHCDSVLGFPDAVEM
jgi:hypothetical protein